MNRQRKVPRAPEKKSIIYNGATMEGKVANALEPATPPPLETEDERQARVQQHSVTAMPCDVRVESVPHGISITFFARAGGALEAKDIRTQVELLARMHNKLFQVPEANVDNGPESVPLALDPGRPDHAPLRALMAIPARATWEETADGAKLVLTADSENDLTDLRAHVRWHAPQLLPEVMAERKRCPQLPSDLHAGLYHE